MKQNLADENTGKLPCEDKIAYESKEKAVGSAAAIRWRLGTKLKTYLCKHCGLWHLASNFDS